MTFLRSSDVKNHLYTGSARKQHLLSKETEADLAIETPPPGSIGVLVPVNAHPAIALAAPVHAELPSDKDDQENKHNGSTLQLVRKVKKAA